MKKLSLKLPKCLYVFKFPNVLHVLLIRILTMPPFPNVFVYVVNVKCVLFVFCRINIGRQVSVYDEPLNANFLDKMKSRVSLFKVASDQTILATNNLWQEMINYAWISSLLLTSSCMSMFSHSEQEGGCVLWLPDRDG